jgi:hypothetical protein
MTELTKISSPVLLLHRRCITLHVMAVLVFHFDVITIANKLLLYFSTKLLTLQKEFSITLKEKVRLSTRFLTHLKLRMKHFSSLKPKFYLNFSNALKLSASGCSLFYSILFISLPNLH